MDTRARASTEAAFLQGGGAMGERIRAFDWESTPLGAPDAWPLPLRTAVRILLTTNHPVFVFWGPQLHCFYNDAFSRSLGPEKHPGMLGATGRAAWAEIWDIIGTQIEYVMGGKGSTWHENHLVPITRHGAREDVYWTYSYSPIDDPAAALGVGGVLVLCTETTGQVLASERAHAAEGRWRQLFDQAPGFMCVLSGPQHVFEFANPGYFPLVGRHDILGKPIREALPWAVEQGFLEVLNEVYASGQPFLARSAPVVVPGANGQSDATRYLDFVYQPVRNERGEINGIFVLGSDVTERKRAEDALRQSEERLRIASDATALGIYDYDITTGTIGWDTRVRSIWGVGQAETITYDVFAAGLHPDDRAPTQEKIDAALHPDGDGRFFAEYRVVHRVDGVSRWVQATGQTTFDGRRAHRLVGTTLDITERKHADARRTEFLATLGHELRNPLAPISNALEVLKRQPQIEEAAHRAHNVIDRQLRHMVRLLEDLLDVVRITYGRIELRSEVVALNEVVQQALEVASPYVENGKHHVALLAPQGVIYVRADAIRLAQVFSNLLINACKYSGAGSRIEVMVRRIETRMVEVRVKDQGIGIATQYLTRVFDMFSQAEPSLGRSQGGLGIGLSLAKGLVELHGGSIIVHSPGLQQGSEFVVQLPVLENARPDAYRPPDVTDQSEVRDLRVLVVDDNQDAATTLGSLLELKGATIAIASDGIEALETAEVFMPHVVLLDIGLPRMNGYEVCRALRRRPWASSVRVVALTGWGQDTDRSQSRAAGFDAHLVKPVDYSELMRSIASAA